jgi:hypothetical protein
MNTQINATSFSLRTQKEGETRTHKSINAKDAVGNEVRVTVPIDLWDEAIRREVREILAERATEIRLRIKEERDQQRADFNAILDRNEALLEDFKAAFILSEASADDEEPITVTT